MPTPLNKELYDKVKSEADRVYDRPSAYKSGWIVKRYKELGGKYADDNKPKNLKRWFKEEWRDIGGQDYPVYRPTKRISKDTPLTASEIDPKQALEQIALKQIIKSESNLPPFLEGGTKATEVTKSNPIWKVSNPILAQQRLNKYAGKNIPLFLSDRKDKKYMIFINDKKIHFGHIDYQDFLKHGNLKRRMNYLNRATNIQGNWKNDKFSPNNLAIHILW